MIVVVDPVAQGVGDLFGHRLLYLQIDQQLLEDSGAVGQPGLAGRQAGAVDAVDVETGLGIADLAADHPLIHREALPAGGPILAQMGTIWAVLEILIQGLDDQRLGTMGIPLGLLLAHQVAGAKHLHVKTGADVGRHHHHHGEDQQHHQQCHTPLRPHDPSSAATRNSRRMAPKSSRSTVTSMAFGSF